MAATQLRRRRKNESDGDSSAGGSANEGGVGRGAGGEGADSAGDGGGSKPTLLLYSSSKYKSLRTRVGSAVVLVVSFAGAIYMGHAWITLYVIGLQTAIVHELFTVARRRPPKRGSKPAQAASDAPPMVDEFKHLPWFRTLNWYWYVCVMYFMYGSLARIHFDIPDVHELGEYAFVPGEYAWALHRLVLHTLRHLSFYSYMMYIAGWVWFVLILEKGTYMYQFSQFAWTHMILIVAVVQTCFLTANIWRGMIWFLLPCSLVIVNDIMAYFSGFFFGRTPLLKISPKKTWEGFIGAIFFTMLWGFFVSRAMAQFEYMTCPQKEVSLALNVPPLTCPTSPLFVDVEYRLPEMVVNVYKYLQFLPSWAKVEVVHIMPVQLHGCVLAAFASIVAPFGGFFASGFKRAMKVKDFSDSIPGHGGVTDRMDCQMMMGLFAFIYCQAFCMGGELSLQNVVALVMLMSREDQVELWRKLGEELSAQGLLQAGTEAAGAQ